MKRIALLASFAMTVTAISGADAAMMAYLRIAGQKSGEVKGGITQKGRENTIGVIAMDHTIVSPRDPQSGLPTGLRQHKIFTIRKELDKSSPVLWNILATSENLKTVTLQFWTPQISASSGVGAEVQNYTITLTNANIASMRMVKENIRNPELMKYADYEEISFTYESIVWTWTQGGITAGDSWTARH